MRFLRQTDGFRAGTRGQEARFVRAWKRNAMTDIDKLIEELVRTLRGRPMLEIVTAARQIENRVRDLYLHEALRKYAADRREEPSRHVVAALHRLLVPGGL
jgi:hypothetical protein